MKPTLRGARCPQSKMNWQQTLEFAKLRGTHSRKIKGSCPHYIWPLMELNYLVRQRTIETRLMTDAHILNSEVYVERRKGSRDNLTTINARLQSAIDHLRLCRRQIWEKKRTVRPFDPAERPLIVNTLGNGLSYRAYQSSWNRFIKMAICEGIITEDERFSLYDLKRRGITDTEGDKQQAGGHKDPRMLEVYDKSIPKVKPSSD